MTCALGRDRIVKVAIRSLVARRLVVNMMKRPRLSFSFKMDENLIQLVRAHEELYDTSNKKYSDTVYKNEVWKKIADVFSLDIDMVKQRWESLRSQYRKKCRRKNRTGVAIGSESKWKYDDHLDFLRAYMKEREILTHQFFSEDTFILSEDGEEVAEEEYIADTPQWQNNENLPHLSQSSYNPVPTTIESSISETGVKSRSKKKKQSATGDKFLNMLDKYLRNQEKADLESTLSKDALDFFFDSMKCTVSKFSEADKYLAKQRIFSIVSEIEAKYVV